MNKAKILFADHVPFAGGAQLRLAEDIKFLDRKKFEPLLVIDKASKFASIYQDSGVEILKTSFPKLNLIHPVALSRLITSVRQFNQLIQKTQPDIVLANTTRTLLVISLAKKMYDLDFKLVSYIRDYDYPKWIFRLVKGQVDKYLFVSKNVQDFYHLPGAVIYLGSNIKDLLAKVIPKVVKKKEYLIGFLGRLVDWKGGEVLLEAFRQLQRPNMKLVFYGTGKNQAGSNEERLKELTKKYHLEKQIIFAGHIDNPALALKTMNCLVLPSKKPEPFATSVIEAAFAGVPIIATNIGGTPEFIQNEKNGLLVLPADTNQLSLALLRLIEDQSLAQKLQAQAYQDVQKFDQKVFIKTLEAELLK